MRSAAILLLAVRLASGEQIPTLDTARKLLAQGDYQQAIGILQKRINAMPSDADAHILLGTALAIVGNRNDAIAQLVESVRLAPRSAKSHNALGSVLSRFAEMKAARSAFTRAVELDGNFAEARVNLALAMAREDETGGAIEQLTRAIAIDGLRPETAYPLYLRAKAYSQLKDFSRATSDLERATTLQPDLAEAWSTLGIARKAASDESGAMKAFEQAVKLKPDDAIAQYQVGAQYLAMGNASSAIGPLRASNRLKAGDRSTLYSLQRALRLDGQGEESVRIQTQLKQVLQKNETLNAASLKAAELNNDGVALEKAGDMQVAFAKYREALELDPSHDGFRLNYGLALCRLGRWTEGITELRDVSERNPDNAEAARALYIAIDQTKAKAIYGPSTLYTPLPAAPKPGSLYPRAIQLNHAGPQNGFMLATFEEYSRETPSFPVYRSTDGGATWSLFSRVRDTETSWGMRFQPFLYELPNALGPMPAGTILCLGNSIPADMSRTRLDMYKSLDHGATWSFVSHIAAGGAAKPDGKQDPVWEPFALFAKDKLIVYYSDERDPKHNQKIVHQTSGDGMHWSNVVDDVALAPALRPGMPVVARMGNDKYLMSWECVCDKKIFSSVKVTADPESWNASDAGTKIEGSGGTPYTVWLPGVGRSGMLVQSSNGRDNLFVNTAYGAPGSNWMQVASKVRAGYSRALAVLSGGKTLFEISPVEGANGYNNVEYGSEFLNIPMGASR